jgi:hypothetical protein
VNKTERKQTLSRIPAAVIYWDTLAVQTKSFFPQERNEMGEKKYIETNNRKIKYKMMFAVT